MIDAMMTMSLTVFLVWVFVIGLVIWQQEKDDSMVSALLSSLIILGGWMLLTGIAVILSMAVRNWIL